MFTPPTAPPLPQYNCSTKMAFPYAFLMPSWHGTLLSMISYAIYAFNRDFSSGEPEGCDEGMRPMLESAMASASCDTLG